MTPKTTVEADVDELPITQADIDGLAEALDGLSLTAAQRRLLTAILATATKVVTLEAQGTFDSFRAQFDFAYTPGLATFMANPPGHIIRD
jgi:hypothetical protein